MLEAIVAVYADWGIGADIWSVTSFNELRISGP